MFDNVSPTSGRIKEKCVDTLVISTSDQERTKAKRDQRLGCKISPKKKDWDVTAKGTPRMYD